MVWNGAIVLYTPGHRKEAARMIASTIVAVSPRAYNTEGFYPGHF